MERSDSRNCLFPSSRAKRSATREAITVAKAVDVEQDCLSVKPIETDLGVSDGFSVAVGFLVVTEDLFGGTALAGVTVAAELVGDIRELLI